MAKVNVHFKAEKTLINTLDATCQQHGLDRSETLRSLMFEFVNKYKEVKLMKKELKIYNGEDRDITIVTDFETVVIKAKDCKMVWVGSDAQFNTGDFYVEEEGNWYAKTEHCNTGCDIEIYNAV